MKPSETEFRLNSVIIVVFSSQAAAASARFFASVRSHFLFRRSSSSSRKNARNKTFGDRVSGCPQRAASSPSEGSVMSYSNNNYNNIYQKANLGRVSKISLSVLAVSSLGRQTTAAQLAETRGVSIIFRREDDSTGTRRGWEVGGTHEEKVTC